MYKNCEINHMREFQEVRSPDTTRFSLQQHE